MQIPTTVRLAVPLILVVFPGAHGHSGVAIRRHQSVLDGPNSPGFASSFLRAGQAESATLGMLKRQYPWYHTSGELRDEARRLVDNCDGKASFRTVNESGVSIDVIGLREPGMQPVNRIFILFGEHSRELISPESGLRLLAALCGQSSQASPEEIQAAAAVLKDSEFGMVLNANPRSRIKVENGDFCLRTNPDGVDLNRNWDEKWVAESSLDDTNAGPKPFSEPETRIFRAVVSDFRPTTFLTIHSGTRGMYMPWAYDMDHLANRNQAAMMQILKELDSKYCQCPYGAAGREVGYNAPGTCLDWVYDQLQAPFSFAFEIYTSADYDDDLRRRWTEKLEAGGVSFLESSSNLGHRFWASLFSTHHSDFVHRHSGRHVADLLGECFAFFNPETQERYNTTVRNWVLAFLATAEETTAYLKQDGQASASLPR